MLVEGEEEAAADLSVRRRRSASQESRMKETLVRQSFLGPKSDEILDGILVAVIGVGGAGSHVVQQLSHVGIGEIDVADPDKAELSNLNRLVGATRSDALKARRKTEIAARRAKAVNPAVRIRSFPVKWQEAMSELRDADIIVICVDRYSERAQIEAFARRYLIPCIDIGMDVHAIGDHFAIAGQVALSMPGDMCFKCMAIITEDDLAKEQYGAAGGNPQVVWSNGVLASIAVGLLVEMVTPWFRLGASSIVLRYDGNAQTVAPDDAVEHIRGRECQHFPASGVGDPHPFWIAHDSP
jgi:molybdopterin/thiamine biosynthesis adenylyltransferase